MQHFNRWLNIISVVFLLTVIIDLNVYWWRHPANNIVPLKTVIILLSLLLTGIVLKGCYYSNKKK
ncbi:hypothetical protein [Chitinophaga nivalis]|uniref:Uncharacterized protein n=1 Tax=Chitinophaga nivalis TaxID=2991709 RepID=A0ABT3IQE4_9BACT|nr:hypothetical protein [Chitinophaga nivalis]MCW3464152.1 hypothetical protein [Chitinophaga nivalis]MCW3486158.1 hypothetical protein [Chitinophaga nivalis]